MPGVCLYHKEIDRFPSSSTAPKSEILGSDVKRSTCVLALEQSMPSSSSIKWRDPNKTREPSTEEQIPCATIYWSCASCASIKCARPFFWAASTMARDTGCGKCSSKQADKRSSSSSSRASSKDTTSESAGVAFVTVPVLSKTTVSTSANASRKRPPFTTTPRTVPSFMADKIAKGVANLKAQL